MRGWMSHAHYLLVTHAHRMLIWCLQSDTAIRYYDRRVVGSTAIRYYDRRVVGSTAIRYYDRRGVGSTALAATSRPC